MLTLLESLVIDQTEGGTGLVVWILKASKWPSKEAVAP